MKLCPCCGQSMAATDPRDVLATVRLSPMERRLCEYLAERFGKWIDREKIEDAVYADDPNGGPENANQCIRWFAFRANRKLAPHGLTVESQLGQGATARRLMWKPEMMALAA